MKTCLTIAALLVTVAGGAQGQILRYDLTGLPGTGTPPASTNASTVAPGLTAISLTRGAGINGTVLASGFSSDNWNNPATASGQTSPTLANAILTGDYYQFGFTVNAGYAASLSTLDVSLRRSAINAPSSFEWQYSFDGFATAGTMVADFNYFGRSSGTAPGTVTPFQWMTADTAGQGNGNPMSQIDLTSLTALQNLAEGTTVTFRLYGYNSTTGAADSNTVGLGRTNGPTLGGTVVATPEPSAFALIGLAAAVCAIKRRK